MAMPYRPVNRVSRAVHVRRPVEPPRHDQADLAEPAQAANSHAAPPREGLAVAPWMALCGDVAVEIRDPRFETLRSVACGTTVVLVCDQPLSRWRLRRLASRAGMVIERELIAVPSTRSPVVLVDEAESAVAHFWNDVITVPPGPALASLPATVVLGLARALPWRWTGAIAPGRVVIGRRT